MFEAIIFLLLGETLLTYDCHQLQRDQIENTVNVTIFSKVNQSDLDILTMDAKLLTTSRKNNDTDITITLEEYNNSTALNEATSTDFTSNGREINLVTAPVEFTPTFNSFSTTSLIKSNTIGTRKIHNSKEFTIKDMQMQEEHSSKHNHEAASCLTCTPDVTLFTSVETDNTSLQLKVTTVSPYISPKSTKNVKKLHSIVQNDIQWPVKKEALVEGDIIVGGLMMIHEREDTVVCGPVMPQGGIQALETMLYTLDVINNPANSILPNFTLGAHILDDCDKDTYGLEMAVDFIKGIILDTFSNTISTPLLPL